MTTMPVGACRLCGRLFYREAKGYHKPSTWIALPYPTGQSWPAVYDALLCRTCVARIRRGDVYSADDLRRLGRITPPESSAP